MGEQAGRSHDVERPQKPRGRSVSELRVARTAFYCAALYLRHECRGAQTLLLNKPARYGGTSKGCSRAAIVPAAQNTCICELTIGGRITSFVDQSLEGVIDGESVAVRRDEGGSDRRQRAWRGATEGQKGWQRDPEPPPMPGHGP